MSILINYPFNSKCLEILKDHNLEVNCLNIAPNHLINYINEHNIKTLVYRGKFDFEASFFEKVPSLNTICLIDNTDLNKQYTKTSGLTLLSPKESLSRSVAELVFAHLLGMVRYLHDSNRQMPLEGDLRFNELRSAYKNGSELKGKTLGIVGTGHVGSEVAKIAIGMGMKVLCTNKSNTIRPISLEFFDGQKVEFNLEPTDLNS